MSKRDKEVETDITPSKDGKKLTIEIKGDTKLDIQDVILELEYLINQLARADDELSKPGYAQH